MGVGISDVEGDDASQVDKVAKELAAVVEEAASAA